MCAVQLDKQMSLDYTYKQTSEQCIFGYSHIVDLQSLYSLVLHVATNQNVKKKSINIKDLVAQIVISS